MVEIGTAYEVAAGARIGNALALTRMGQRRLELHRLVGVLGQSIGSLGIRRGTATGAG